MKRYKCADGFVTKILEASSAQEAADAYTIVSTTVDVVEVDVAGNELGEHVTIRVEIAE